MTLWNGSIRELLSKDNIFMLYIILVLAFLSLAAVIAAAASASGMRQAKTEMLDLRKSLKAVALDILKDKKEHEEALSRRDTIIAQLKDELMNMETDLANHSSSADVRDRLNKLFP